MLAHDSSPKGRAKALRAKWVSRQLAARMKCVPYGVRGRVKKPGGHLPSRLGRSLCPIQYAERKLATSRAVPNGLSVTDQLQLSDSISEFEFTALPQRRPDHQKQKQNHCGSYKDFLPRDHVVCTLLELYRYFCIGMHCYYTKESRQRQSIL